MAGSLGLRQRGWFGDKMKESNKKIRLLICDVRPLLDVGEVHRAYLKKSISLDPEKFDIQILDVSSNRNTVIANLLALTRVPQCIKQMKNSDVVLLQSPFTPATIVLGACAMTKRVPFIVVPRGDFPPPFRLFRMVRKPILKWTIWLMFVRLLLSRAYMIVVTSEKEGKRLQLASGGLKNLCVIPNPSISRVKGEEQLPRNGQSLWEEHRPFALFLGRISWEKGLDILLNCWPAVIMRSPGALLILAGPVAHPEVLSRLMRIRKRLKLEESILFMGWVEGKLKRQLMARARCLVLPSHFESFGNVVLEALAVGTPVVASTGTPWKDLDGIAGRWIPREEGAWAEAIAEYLRPGRKAALDEETKSRLLEPFRSERVTEMWGELIESSARREPVPRDR